jgi:hypothetical protein
VEKIADGTGVRRPVVSGLIDSICRTCARMKAMNFLTRGQLEQR